MCGIAGVSLSRQELGTVSPRSLTKQLLLAIENRGRDATGFAYTVEGRNDIHYLKLGIKASDFTKARHHIGIPRDSHTVIAHTRAGTGGTPKDADNNHPLVVQYNGQASIVGIHNGVIYNEDALWKANPDLKAIKRGLVDSQIIWQMYAKYGEDGLKEIEGDASVAWLTAGDDADLMTIAKMCGRPLHAATTKGGSFIFCSTEKDMDEALKHFKQVEIDTRWDLKDGEMIAVRKGVIVDSRDDFPTLMAKPKAAYSYTGSGYGGAWWDEDDRYGTPVQGKSSGVHTKAKPKPQPKEVSETEMTMWENVFGRFFPRPTMDEIIDGLEVIYSYFRGSTYYKLERAARDEVNDLHAEAAAIARQLTEASEDDGAEAHAQGLRQQLTVIDFCRGKHLEGSERTVQHATEKGVLIMDCRALVRELCAVAWDIGVKQEAHAVRSRLAQAGWNMTTDDLGVLRSRLIEEIEDSWLYAQDMEEVVDEPSLDDQIDTLLADTLGAGDPGALGMPDWTPKGALNA